ncbi:MAG TPA: YlbF family regulator, partial [Ruminococcaceae bacterium]|nr:YlbF family regulator [Oscillospiraceae bacterium]
VNQIIVGSVNGQDPDSIEEQSSCGGSCSSCSGCH